MPTPIPFLGAIEMEAPPGIISAAGEPLLDRSVKEYPRNLAYEIRGFRLGCFTFSRDPGHLPASAIRPALPLALLVVSANGHGLTG